jgi:hypothetical protein
LKVIPSSFSLSDDYQPSFTARLAASDIHVVEYAGIKIAIDRMGGALQEVSDLDQFLAAWTDFYRIEDFAFVPEEKMRNFVVKE